MVSEFLGCQLLIKYTAHRGMCLGFSKDGNRFVDIITFTWPDLTPAFPTDARLLPPNDLPERNVYDFAVTNITDLQQGYNYLDRWIEHLQSFKQPLAILKYNPLKETPRYESTTKAIGTVRYALKMGGRRTKPEYERT